MYLIYCTLEGVGAEETEMKSIGGNRYLIESVDSISRDEPDAA